MCYLNRTANTCSICISNSDRLGCGSVQRSTWAGLMGYNYWACYKMLQVQGVVSYCPIAGQCWTCPPSWRNFEKRDRQTKVETHEWHDKNKRHPYWMHKRLQKDTKGSGTPCTWSSDDVLSTWATNIYQQIFASRGDVEPLPNLEVTEMKAMCSTCLVHFFGADVPTLSCLDWLNHLDLGSLMLICVFWAIQCFL